MNMQRINILLQYIIFFLLCNNATVAQNEEFEVFLGPVESYDILSGGLKPVYKILDNEKLYYKNKKYNIIIPATNAEYGVVFMSFAGNSNSKIPDVTPILIEDLGGDDPRFFMDANNNLDFTDDGHPRHYMDTAVRKFGNLHRYVPFSIASSGDNSRTFTFHLLETNDTSSYYFLRKSVKSSKKMQLADTEHWFYRKRINMVKGAITHHDETFEIIFEDSYCTTDYSRKGNYVYTGPTDVDFNFLDKWRITESTVITLGNTNFKLKEIDATGMKAVFVIADTDKKLRYHQNDTVPDFAFKLTTGKKTCLNNYLGKDKNVLLYFWGTWCAPCRARHPEMIELYSRNQDKLEILAFAYDKKNAVKKYIKENEIGWPNALPDKKLARELMKSLNVTGYPGFVLLDQHGVILLENAQPGSIAKLLEND